MTESNDRDFTDSSPPQKGGSGKKNKKPPPKRKVNGVVELEAKIKKLELVINKSAKSVRPDDFMTFDCFCFSMDVTEDEKPILLASLRTDPEFLELSQRNMRLFGRTGIKHLFKIKQEVQEKTGKRKACKK